MKKTNRVTSAMHYRYSLLARTSTFALVTAAANIVSALPAHAACGTTFDPLADTIGSVNITSPFDCVVINNNIGNNLTVNDDIVGSPGGPPVFDVSGGITIGGRFTNNELIEALTGNALSFNGANVNGGITNNGIIQADYGTALILRYGSDVGPIVNEGLITGIVGIDGAEGIWVDSLTNADSGVIYGEDTGILIGYGNTVQFFGAITNSGLIEGGDVGIRHYPSGGTGGIINERDGIIRGGLTNTGSIVGTNVAIFIGPSETSYSGGLTNEGLIEAYSGGYVFQATTFDGDIVNSGSIIAEVEHGAIHIGGTGGECCFLTNSFNGNFENTGLVDGGEEYGVLFEVGTLQGSGGEGSTADLRNSGNIFGGFEVYANEVNANFTNERQGTISANSYTAVTLEAQTWNGNVSNAGIIDGGYIGMAIVGDGFFEGKSTFIGTVANSGHISGGSTGLLIDVTEFTGSIINSGTIIADGDVGETNLFNIESESYGAGLYIGGLVEEGDPQTFSGDITNTDLIQGRTGLRISLDSYNGGETGFSNSGSIVGTSSAGVSIDVERWDGAIRNTGSIYGAQTGFFINAGTITGDFINEGQISGDDIDTGLHIEALTYTGNIVNAGLLDAPGNALHLEIDSLYGDITNSGTILATAISGTAVLLEGNDSYPGTYHGEFLNTGLITGGGEGTGIEVDGVEIIDGIRNDGGTITAEHAIDTRDASATTVITNTGGGIINGDLRLNTTHGDQYIGEDGGIYGDIVGDGGGGEADDPDDLVTVRNGTHFFVGNIDELISLTVEDGGVALFGTDTFGENGAGFSGEGISSLNIEDGARAYFDDNAEIYADYFTLGTSEGAGGELTYFLTTDEAIHGEIVTGGSLSTATINGDISVVIDPVSFAGSSQTLFDYQDVISSGDVIGTFSNSYIVGNPFLFTLGVIYDAPDFAGDPDTVDLTIARLPLSSINCSSSTLNGDNVGAVLEQAFQNGDLTEEQLALYAQLFALSDGCAITDAFDDLSGLPFDFLAFQLDGPFKKMVGARIDSGRSTGCLVAGPGGCFNRYAENTTAGSTAMTDASPGEDPFAWLETGVRRAGSSAVWGRAVGVWGNTDGDTGVGAPGSDFNQKGAIVGADHVFSNTFLAGVAAQFTDTDINFPGRPDQVHVNSYEIGAYSSWGDTQAYLNTNVSYIKHAFDTSRTLFGDPTSGDFDGATLSACLEIGTIFESGDWRLQPIMALSLASLTTDGYTENGINPDRLVVQDSGFDSLKSVLGGRFAYPIELKSGRLLVPELRVSWNHELLDNSAQFNARLFSFAEDPASYFTVNGAEFDRDSVNLGAGVNAPVNDRTILYFDYDASLSSDQESQTVSGGLRILW